MKITVLGGGTSGWLTSLFLKKHLPNYEISLIESEKIGIIGVGEGTTPMLIPFLEDLEINIRDLVKETDATIKHGIFFYNWLGQQERYFHSFGVHAKANDMSNHPVFRHSVYDYYLRYLINNRLNLEEWDYATMLASNKKVDLDNAGWALHFNSRKFSDHLKNIAINRGVIHHIDDFTHVSHDSDNFITKLNCVKKSYDCDFVFDCTGFYRQLIDKFYQTKWISYQDYLPLKKAIPFFLDSEETIDSYTSAIAMKYGWIWKIPLQNRIGSGYIFDSDYINEEQALKEAEQFFNRKLTINKVIPFKAGRYEKAWIKNCMSIGLSYGFTEPLEATSIQLQVGQLFLLKNYLNKLKNYDEEYINRFNTSVAKGHDETLDFLHLHYISNKNDSPFWKELKFKTKIPENLKPMLDKLKTARLENYHMKPLGRISSFDYSSFLMVAYGLNIIEKKFDNEIYENFTPNVQLHRNNLNNLLSNAFYHHEFIKSS